MKRFRMLLPYLKESKAMIALAFFFAAVSVFFKMAIPFITGLAIDKIRLGDMDISLHLVLMGGCLILGSAFRYFFDLFTAYVAQKAVQKMRNDLFDALNQMPVSYLDSHYHGDLLSRLVGDIENVQTGLITGAGALFEGVVQALVTLAFMFVLNWLLALTVIVLTPISVIVSRFLSSRNSK